MAHVHGVGRLGAAIAAAPVAAGLATLALAALLPAGGDVRLLVALLGVLPAAAVAVCLALLARSAARAWLGCAGVSALAALVLVLT